MSNRVGRDAGFGRDGAELRPRAPSELGFNEFDCIHHPMIAKMQTNAIALLLPLVGQTPPMNVKKVVAENLQALINYAAVHNQPYADAKSLAIKARVSPSTVGHILKQETAARINTLQALAAVYKLTAWSLLIPNLDPSNPPVVPYSDTERALYWRIRSVAKDFLATEGGDMDDDQRTTSTPDGVDSNSQNDASRKTKPGSKAPKKVPYARNG
jgi:hypothetical protein